MANGEVGIVWLLDGVTMLTRGQGEPSDIGSGIHGLPSVHRQNLVYQQDLGLQMGSHGKGQAHVHAAGVVLDRRVYELLDPSTGSGRRLGKGHDASASSAQVSSNLRSISALFIPRPVLSISKG